MIDHVFVFFFMWTCFLYGVVSHVYSRPSHFFIKFSVVLFCGMMFFIIFSVFLSLKHVVFFIIRHVRYEPFFNNYGCFVSFYKYILQFYLLDYGAKWWRNIV